MGDGDDPEPCELRMSPVRRMWSRWTAALVCGGVIAGCDQAPTQPNPRLRLVNVIVEDAGGARVQGAGVCALRADSSTATQPGSCGDTDAAGVAHLGLADGQWIVFATMRRNDSSFLVAGSSGVVVPRPGLDTIQFRLVLRPESFARGRITLDGRTAFGNSLVQVLGLAPFTLTAADGSYELPHMPPGSWTLLAGHVGFQTARLTIEVPAAGDTVDAGAIALAPAAPMARR